MAITAYADLLPAMVAQLPDCSDDLMEQALQLGGRTFCLETEALINTLTADDGVADQTDYAIAAPTSHEVLRIYQVYVRTEEEVTDGEDGTLQDPSKFEYEFLDKNLKFYTAPFVEDITGGLVVRVVVAPLEDLAVLDATFLSRWAEYIKAWAFFHLYSMTGKVWASPPQSARYFSDFRTGVAYARRDKHILFTTRTPVMQYTSFLDR